MYVVKPRHWEGWQVERRQEFESDLEDALYDRVLICWCIPIQTAVDATAA